jgi:hypothetical protein
MLHSIRLVRLLSSSFSPFHRAESILLSPPIIQLPFVVLFVNNFMKYTPSLPIHPNSHTRLHIPAGILRILSHRNLNFRSAVILFIGIKRSKNLRSKTKALGRDLGMPRVPSGTVLQLLRLAMVKSQAATILLSRVWKRRALICIMLI